MPVTNPMTMTRSRTLLLCALLALSLAGCERLHRRAEAAVEPDAPPAEFLAAPLERTPPPAESAGEDDELGRRVKRALVAAPGIRAETVAVIVEDGVVILTGPAPSAAERARIGALAATVDGVAGVVNKLSVPDGA
jgi:hypothetical protein